MKGRRAVLIEKQPLSPGPTEDSESESLSLSDSFVYSDTESLGESVGSVNMAGCSKPKPSLELGSPRRRKRKEGSQFLMFSKEIPDVPMQKIWSFVRDHKMLASVIPGVIEGLDFVEGEGGTGSVYVAHFNPKAVKPGDDRFLINKVEVSDDESKLYAVRCVGGRDMKIFNLYITYVNVFAHEVNGHSSTVLVWRFEYDLINPNSPLPENTKRNYMTALDLISERHLAMNRVERPLVVSWAGMGNVTKRLRVPGGQKRLTGAEEQEEPEDRFQQETEERSERRRKRQGKGKGKAEHARVNDDEGSDRGSRIKKTRGGRQSVNFRQEDEVEGSTIRSFHLNNQD